jgi:hypothetical protein
VARDLILDGEDVGQTIGLLQAARAQRVDAFDSQEWRDLDDILSQLVAKQMNVQPPGV